MPHIKHPSASYAPLHGGDDSQLNLIRTSTGVCAMMLSLFIVAASQFLSPAHSVRGSVLKVLHWNDVGSKE